MFDLIQHVSAALLVLEPLILSFMCCCPERWHATRSAHEGKDLTTCGTEVPLPPRFCNIPDETVKAFAFFLAITTFSAVTTGENGVGLKQEQWGDVRNSKMRSESIYKAEKVGEEMVNEIKKACKRMSWRNERWRSPTEENNRIGKKSGRT